MKLLLAIVAALVLTAPAIAGRSPIRPEAHPSCHCKARWDHGAYKYTTTARVMDSDGHTYAVQTRCVVNPRTGVTNCSAWLRFG